MAELSRNGHRQRMREQYLNGSMNNSPDHNTLELFLSIIIPRHDVKDLAYDLINTFGSLEGVFSASPDDLMKVKGVGESTATALSMVYFFHDRIIADRNKDTVKLTSNEQAKRFCINELRAKTVENFIQINLRNDGSIIKKYVISTGRVNATDVNKSLVLTNAVKDSAAYVIVAHNHPHGIAQASAGDIDFTISLYRSLSDLGIKLVDHFVVADNDAAVIIHSREFEKSFNLSETL